MADGEFTGRSNSKQTWELSRQVDGQVRLKTHFLLANPASQLLAALGPKLLSGGLKTDLDHALALTELDATLTPGWKTEGLIIRGYTLKDKKPLDVVACTTSNSEVVCKGVRNTAKTQNEGTRELIYPVSPFFYRTLAVRAKKAPNQTITIPVVELAVDETGASKLLVEDSIISPQGEEEIVLGERRFNGWKFLIRLKSKERTKDATIWLSGNDVILKIEDENNKLLLSKFKKSQDF